jgi:hypothetical protein
MSMVEGPAIMVSEEDICGFSAKMQGKLRQAKDPVD